MNTLDTVHILRAASFAAKAHEGQTRKGGEDYIQHPLRVARRVAAVPGATTDMVVAALLHDVLEDCPQVTKEEIFFLFGKTVLDFVEALTDLPKEAGNREFRKVKDAERIAQAGWEVQTIKVADTLDNTGSIVVHKPDFAPLYIKEKQHLLGLLTVADHTLLMLAKLDVEFHAKAVDF